MTAQQQRFGWSPGADGGAGGVELVDLAGPTGQAQVVSVPEARRWAVHRAAETGDGTVLNELEQLLTQHGAGTSAPTTGASSLPEVMVPTSSVNELHPEWTMGGGFVLRGGSALSPTPTRRPVSLKQIAALIFYLRQVGQVEEAARIRAETKGLCVIARRLTDGQLGRPGRPAGGHSVQAVTGADVDGGKHGR